MSLGKIYFIQVSSSAYSKKSKQQQHLYTDKAMDGSIALTADPIAVHYTTDVSRIR